MLAKFFAPLSVKIGAGIIALLLVALGIVMWRADAISGQRDKAIQRAANEAAAHAVTKASLAKLEQRLAAFIAAGERRTEAARKAVEAQEARSAALTAQIARLRSTRPTAVEIERCESAGDVLRAEGL